MMRVQGNHSSMQEKQMENTHETPTKYKTTKGRTG